MKRIYYFLCFALFFTLIGNGTSVYGQFNNNYWLFGDSAGINWTNSSNPSFFTTQLKGRGTSVSLSDSTGVLIYSGTGQKPNIIDQEELNKLSKNWNELIEEDNEKISKEKSSNYMFIIIFVTL